MSQTAFSLSKASNRAGLHQVLCRVTISRDVRLRLKTDILALDGLMEGGTVIIPKRGKLNAEEIETKKELKLKLDKYAGGVSSLLMLSSGRISVTKDWLETAAILWMRDQIGTGSSLDEVNAAVEAYMRNQDEIENSKEKVAKSAETFHHIIMEYCNSAERGTSETRKRSYKCLARMLARFELFVRYVEKRRSFCIDFEKLTSDDINAFRDFVRNEAQLKAEYPKIFSKIIAEVNASIPQCVKSEHGRQPEHDICARKENYVVLKTKQLRALYNWLVKTGRVKSSPFANVTVGSEHYETDPYYLSIEERNRLADFDFGDDKRLELVRDVFIFECLIGARVSDLVQLTKNNISDGFLIYTPGKTLKDEGAIIPHVPLCDRAIRLIEKYDGVDEAGRLFPFLCPQYYNRKLKKVLKAAGFDRPVEVSKGVFRPLCDVAASHMGRRTFVGACYSVVQDPCVISPMSGHKPGSRAFLRYRNVDHTILQKTINMIQ